MIDNYTWQYMYQGTDFNMKIYQFFSYTLFVVLANFRKYMRYLKKMNKKKTIPEVLTSPLSQWNVIKNRVGLIYKLCRRGQKPLFFRHADIAR